MSATRQPSFIDPDFLLQRLLLDYKPVACARRILRSVSSPVVDVQTPGIRLRANGQALRGGVPLAHDQRRFHAISPPVAKARCSASQSDLRQLLMFSPPDATRRDSCQPLPDILPQQEYCGYGKGVSVKSARLTCRMLRQRRAALA
ncbi:hypothetical protein KCP73_05385 [Salmonella enterica subsp. enterica]|nr:hypothetical protein KCP73_05385 [Salmonella enterica subsp. enterica]